MKNRKGVVAFIELPIVCAILMALTGVLLPVVHTVREAAKRAELHHKVEKVMEANNLLTVEEAEGVALVHNPELRHEPISLRFWVLVGVMQVPAAILLVAFCVAAILDRRDRRRKLRLQA